MNILGYTLTTSLHDIVNHVVHHGSHVMINTINPHSYIVAKKDPVFREALKNSDYLLPDGIGFIWAALFLNGKKIKKIAGADLHDFLLRKLNEEHGSCFYLGSNPETLELIRDRLAKEYPNITAGFYSPPFKAEFSEEDSEAMISAVNGEMAKWRNGENSSSENSSSEVAKMRSSENISSEKNSSVRQLVNSRTLFIGMTAPKQEKWSYQFRDRIDAGLICNIGAVFDFYAGTVKRSSPFWIRIGLEWLPRFLKEPKRLYRRVFVSGPLFLWDVFLCRVGIKKD